MPSPFPGMDPYLEDPDVWPDFHDHFAAEIAAELNSTLPRPFYARLGKWAVEVKIHWDPVEHHFVEVRDASRGHAVVTVIEIVSPSNKYAGPDRTAYLDKQREILQSDASLVEIDLLRAGTRLFPDPALETVLAQRDPAPDYQVLVHRAWKRSERELACEFFPILLTESLPCITVPLRENLPEPLLDLQFVMNRAYARGPYLRGAVDYTQLPRPPLKGERAAWAEQLVREFMTGQNSGA